MSTYSHLAEMRYDSRFRNWERQASVRAKPRRLISELGNYLFFPPELMPVVDHPLMRSMGEDSIQRLLLQRLYVYLDFTAELEQLAVNPVVQRLTRQKFGFDLPEQMLIDGYKICTDESWHAQFTDDLQRQLEQSTGVAPVRCPEPLFIRRLKAIEAAEPQEIRGLSSLFFTVVSETLISAILADIPQDRRIVPVVREVIADHAEDEGRHHAFFVKVFEHVWPQLHRYQQDLIGPLLAEFIVTFLQPDHDALSEILRTRGLNKEQIEGVLKESHPTDEMRRDIRTSARSGLQLFHRNGVLQEPRTYDAFAQHGLIE